MSLQSLVWPRAVVTPGAVVFALLFMLDSMARASLAFYNTREEIDALLAGIRKVQEVFA